MLKKALEKLKMFGALEALERVKGNAECEAFALALLHEEQRHRELCAMRKRLSGAKFPIEKDWSDLNPRLNPTIRYQDIQALTQTDFIAKRENICLMGQQGTGKTHSLIALGRDMCRNGISTRFYTACGLVTELEEAKIQCRLSKLMKQLLKPSLLIIDELGFVPFSQDGARLLFDVFAGRYERGSIAVSTNLSFEKWTQVFGTPELTGALLDRFTHHAHVFTFLGESIRFKKAKKNVMS